MDKTSQLMSQYVMRIVDKHDHVRTVDLLKRACQVHLNARVSLDNLDVVIPAKGSALRAFWMRFEDGSFQICLSPGQDDPWRRFAICKELFHIIIDKPEYRTPDLPVHVKEMVKRLPFGTPTSPAVIAEYLAEIGAMEYLLPYACRQKERDQVKDGNYQPISEKYVVPLVLVEQYLTDDYMKYLEPFASK